MTLAIDELERHLGMQLIVRRKGKGATVTQDGSRVLMQTREALNRLEQLSANATLSLSAVAGRFNIGCFMTLAPFFVPPIVEEFERRYPDVELEVETADAPHLHEQLMQGRVDAALLFKGDVPGSLAFDPILEDRPHILVSDDHPFAARGEVWLRELVDERLIMLDVPRIEAVTLALFERLGLSPIVGHTSRNYETARGLVGHGLGYCLMVQHPASAVTYTGRAVRALKILDDVPAIVIGLARPFRAPHTARYSALRELLHRMPTGGTLRTLPSSPQSQH